MRKDIGKTMSLYRSFRSRIEGAITIPVFIAKPIPTFIGTTPINLRPKPFNGIGGLDGVGTMDATAGAGAQSDVCLCGKPIPAKGAINHYWHLFISTDINIAHCPLVVNAVS